MAKKGANTKVEAANNRKASSKADKERQKEADREAKEAEKWSQGSKKKGRKEADNEKKAALLQKKQEIAQQLAEEEKTLSKPKPAKAQVKKALFTTERVRPSATKATKFDSSDEETQKKLKPILTDKDIEKHPERRFKNALKEFEERELKNYRAQYPGLRLSQLKEIIYKDFQKSPHNPFNQTNVVSYNTSLDEAKRKINGEPEPEEEEENEEEEGEDKESESNSAAALNIKPGAKAVSSY